MNESASLLVLLPSLRISGGVAEALKLARELQARGVMVQVVSFWKHAHELDTADLSVEHLIESAPERSRALLQLPMLALRFIRMVRRWRLSQPSQATFLLTHFTTFFFAWLTPRVPRICFNQDQEWLFVKEGWKRELLKKVILFTSRRSTVITANNFISTQFEGHGVSVFGETSIWADAQWLASDVSSQRNIDVTMLLRMSPFKRLDLSLSLLQLLREKTGLRVSVVTPEEDVATMAGKVAGSVLLRPSNASLKALFGSTRVFVLLSDVEGFGLPPLEAMGSGAIPLCRDSGGVRNYMQGIFAPFLIPKTEPVEAIRDRILSLLAGDSPTPAEAQAAFALGLALSLEKRAETLNRLCLLLQTR